MPSKKIVMRDVNNSQELYPHNFADQTWTGDSFSSVPTNLVASTVYYGWSITQEGVFQDKNANTGYIDDGALYTTDSLDSTRCVGVLVDVNAGEPYVVRYTNRFTGLTGSLHWLDGDKKELSHTTFGITGREFVAPEGAHMAAIGWYGVAPINTRIVLNFGVLTKGGFSVQDWINGVIDGSITVGNSNNLGGNPPEYYYYRHEAEQLIQDLTDGTFTVNNSYHLDGKPISYFATKEEFDLFVDQIINGPLTVDNSNNLGGIPADEYLLIKDAVKVYSGNSAPGTIAGAKLNDLYIQLIQ